MLSLLISQDTALYSSVTVLLFSQKKAAMSSSPQVVGTTAGVLNIDPSGGTNYNIPIQTPEGIAGIKPSVSLNYSSHAGNGSMGLGWSLNAGSAITRCGKTLYHDGETASISLDAGDRFCLDGHRLILISAHNYGAPGSRYKTEIDNFSYIEAVSGTTGDPDCFRVVGKDGSLK